VQKSSQQDEHYWGEYKDGYWKYKASIWWCPSCHPDFAIDKPLGKKPTFNRNAALQILWEDRVDIEVGVQAWLPASLFGHYATKYFFA